MTRHDITGYATPSYTTLTKLGYAALRNAKLRYAKLRYTKLYATPSHAALATLRYAKLRSAKLRYAKLCYVTLRYARLATLHDAFPTNPNGTGPSARRRPCQSRRHSATHMTSAPPIPTHNATHTTPYPPITTAQCHPYDALPASRYGPARRTRHAHHQSPRHSDPNVRPNDPDPVQQVPPHSPGRGSRRPLECPRVRAPSRRRRGAECPGTTPASRLSPLPLRLRSHTRGHVFLRRLSSRCRAWCGARCTRPTTPLHLLSTSSALITTPPVSPVALNSRPPQCRRLASLNKAMYIIRIPVHTRPHLYIQR